MISIHPITPECAGVYKAVRLRALQDTPSAFCTTYAQESTVTDAQWHERAARFLGGTGTGLIALEDDEPCGLVRGSPDEGGDATVAWVESMWVAPTHRKRGVGRLLIDSVEAWARPRGVRTLKLMVTSTNDPAIAFYERLMFVRTGKTAPHRNNPAVPEWEMARPVHLRTQRSD